MGSQPPTRPNFLAIVADDLGFGDCSCFGSEISTPNIDRLASQSGSIRFAEFHIAAACSPTRSMLMTGTDHHIAGLGQLQEITRNSPDHRGKPGHEGYLNKRVVALPELLRDGGYLTLMSGKWHLGIKPEHHPNKRSFNKSFALLPGCANHYAYEPEYQDPKSEPGKFFETATRALHAENGKFLAESELGPNWYSSGGYTYKLLSYLSDRTDKERQQPFFAYLPFSAPHWPLQAPKDTCDKYRGFYDDGPEALCQKRLQRLKGLGLIDKDVVPHPVATMPGEPAEWDQLDDETRASSARAMEVYAGMVDRMDWNIGRMIQYLKDRDEYDNTIILFMSDNGAEGASYEAYPLVGTTIMDHVHEYYDNSLENIGRGNSFVWYGARSAQAATAPSRLYKMFSTKGGCRVPLVVKPVAEEAASNSIVTDVFCTVMDIVPTILEYAGLGHPDTYAGRPVMPLHGKSWKPFLGQLDKMSRAQALFVVEPMITFVSKPKGPQRWELFNVKTDPGEMNDLTESQPELMAEMLNLWEEYKAEVGVVGLAGEFPSMAMRQGAPQDTPVKDGMEDPYAWIKYIKRPDITPEELVDVVPV
ncbi:Arylsulfatase [Fusarium austroafricanum]|uniref:Arylsulfatase n=1 Tax=Fusarium austroafricanum TaxID=2364996 RepID=A0A8H4KLU2_9HYPO|nr:Arylsulfatase [Fusarium austroafricanum]